MSQNEYTQTRVTIGSTRYPWAGNPSKDIPGFYWYFFQAVERHIQIQIGFGGIAYIVPPTQSLSDFNQQLVWVEEAMSFICSDFQKRANK